MVLSYDNCLTENCVPISEYNAKLEMLMSALIGTSTSSVLFIIVIFFLGFMLLGEKCRKKQLRMQPSPAIINSEESTPRAESGEHVINLIPIVPVYEEVIPENIEVTENVAYSVNQINKNNYDLVCYHNIIL